MSAGLEPENQSERPLSPEGAVFAMVVLTSMNLLNYIDRYVPSAVKDLFKNDLGLTDTQTSLPFSAFVLVYMVASPIFGGLADRYSRKWLIALGVALWSAATASAALAVGFWTFFLARALVGVGEAAYATIAPSLLADFFPPSRRNRILTLFYVAIPVGAALGFILGGLIGQHYGWRIAFLVCGLPGVLAAGLALFIKEPQRGAFDRQEEAGRPPSWREALSSLGKNRTYVLAVAGYAAVTFAAGGMAEWFPAFLMRYRSMDVAEAGSLVGTVTVAGGLGGTLLGGLLADRLGRWTKNPYLALSGLSMIPSAVFAALAIVVQTKLAVGACIFLAQFFLWFYNGPINTVIVNAVKSSMRARAFGLSTLAIHLLGDAISPPLIGQISDRVGDLRPGILLIPLTMLVGAFIWLYAWRRIEPMSSNQAPGSESQGPEEGA